MKKIPQRSCIGCGLKRDKSDLLRIVRSPEGEFSLDPSGRKNGRGAYICKDPACLEKAEKRKALQRSFKAEADSRIYQQLREELEQLAE